MVRSLSRLGKRIVFGARRRSVRRHPPDDRRAPALARAGQRRSRARLGLAAFDFADGTLLFTEASSQQARVAATSCAARPPLAAHRSRRRRRRSRSTPQRSAPRCARANHTLKRSLTDPHLFSGIGNAYSDEILHAAGLSPVKLTQSLDRRRGGAGCSTRRARRPAASGRRGCARRPATASRRRSRPSARRWRCTAGIGQPCPRCGAAGAAHRLRRQRGELLRRVPDRRTAARRPRAVAPAARRTGRRRRKRWNNDRRPAALAFAGTSDILAGDIPYG